MTPLVARWIGGLPSTGKKTGTFRDMGVRFPSAVVRETVVSIADTIASTSGYYVTFGLTDDLSAILSDLEKNPTVDYADFISSDGSVLSQTNESRMPASLKGRELGREPVTEEVVLAGGKDGQLFIRPFYETREITADSTPRGAFRLVVNHSSAANAFNRLLVTNGIIALLALGLVIVIAIAAAGRTLKPILDVIDSASVVSRGDLTRRADVKTSDEIGILASTFNTMAGNLEKTLVKVATAQGKIKGVVETVGSRSETVIRAVERQGGVLDDAYASIDTLNSGIRKISENVEALSASSEETSSSRTRRGTGRADRSLTG